MTARISLILGKSGAHRAPLQLRPVNLFTASMTADNAAIVTSPAVIDRRYSNHQNRELRSSWKLSRVGRLQFIVLFNHRFQVHCRDT